MCGDPTVERCNFGDVGVGTCGDLGGHFWQRMGKTGGNRTDIEHAVARVLPGMRIDNLAPVFFHMARLHVLGGHDAHTVKARSLGQSGHPAFQTQPVFHQHNGIAHMAQIVRRGLVFMCIAINRHQRAHSNGSTANALCHIRQDGERRYHWRRRSRAGGEGEQSGKSKEEMAALHGSLDMLYYNTIKNIEVMQTVDC